MNQKKLRGVAARISAFGAAAAVVSVLSFGDANAAPVFSLSGGSSGTLPNNFDGSYSGLTKNATPITFFDSSQSGGGLKVDTTNVHLVFEFLGKEAGFTNESWAIGAINSLMFNNNVTPGTIDATYSDGFTIGPDGFVPFFFRADTGPGGNPSNAVNGGSVAPGLATAFVKITDNSYYALFDDAGGNPNDHDFDDLVMRITATCSEGSGCGGPVLNSTPLPAAAWLLGSVLAGGAGFGRWRKRRAKRALAAA